MVLCICNVLGDREITACVKARPVADVNDVFQAFNCEPRCASCIPEIQEIVSSVQSSR